MNKLATIEQHKQLHQTSDESTARIQLAAVPVVVIGAPLGAMFCSLLRRQTIVNILIGLILIELLTSLLIILLRVTIIYMSLIIFILFSLLNYWMYSTDIYAIKSIKRGTVK